MKLKNKFEKEAYSKLTRVNPKIKYESIKLTYTIESKYVPDFVDEDNKQIVETKGLFRPEDRRKVLAVKTQHPDWTILMVFYDPNKKLNKASKTTYAQWCDKNGIKWATIHTMEDELKKL